MGSKNKYDGIHEYAVEAIRYRARTLVGQAGYSYSDVEDIEQDLMLDLFERLVKYDAAKAQLTTYIDRVVDHKIANLLEERRAAKRDFRKTSVSVDEPFVDDNGHQATILDFTSTDDYLDRMGFQDRPIHDQHIIQIDLETTLRQLHPDERRLLELLKMMTLAEAARELGVARTTLGYQLRRLCKKLETLGLDESWSLSSSF